MRRLATLAFVGAAVALLGAVLLRAGEDPSAETHGHHPHALPAFAAPTLDGDTIALADLRGSVILVNLWATWCRPCVRELPSLERLERDLEDEGLRVLAVNVDRLPEDRAAAEVGRFLEAHGIDLTVLLDPRGRSEELFGSLGLPTTVVVDRQGGLAYRRLGEGRWDEPPLRDHVVAALGR